MIQLLRVAIDGNEANIKQRVGSNVYAFKIMTALENLTRDKPVEVTILLREQPQNDLPAERKNWHYRVLKPSFFWTQFAEPIYLFLHRKSFNLFYTPGHYAPRLCVIPYISSVMDLAFLQFGDQFNRSDLVQLKYWTRYSIKHAAYIITISQFSKQDIVQKYHQKPDKIVVAPPGISPPQAGSSQESKNFFSKYKIRPPYFLFLGSFQPRKNLIRIVKAYEQLCRRLSSQQLQRPNQNKKLPQLILAGKTGWLAGSILERVKQSAFFDYIIMPGFVPEAIKPQLYGQAVASLQLGLYEGFGIPALESLQYDCVPIAAQAASLPEVVGTAGIMVDPTQVSAIAQAMDKSYNLTAKAKAAYLKKGRKQLRRFSWEKSAQLILDTMNQVKNAN